MNNKVFWDTENVIFVFEKELDQPKETTNHVTRMNYGFRLPPIEWGEAAREAVLEIYREIERNCRPD